MNDHLALKLMLFALQVYRTDPLSLIQFTVNFAAQYLTMCMVDLPLNATQIQLKHFFTPITGLQVAKQYIQNFKIFISN